MSQSKSTTSEHQFLPMYCVSPHCTRRRITAHETCITHTMEQRGAEYIIDKVITSDDGAEYACYIHFYRPAPGLPGMYGQQLAIVDDAGIRMTDGWTLCGNLPAEAVAL